MKAFNTVLSLILLIAVAYLFIHEFSSDTASANTGMSSEELNENLEGQDMSGVRIAYVNTDSLVEKYEYHRELSAQLEKKARRLEQEMAQKTKAFQENITLLEQKASQMNEAQLQQAQMDLQRVQQNLMAYRDQKGMELSRQRSELDSLIKLDLDTILNNIKNEYDIDFILSFDPNSILLAANENYDITPMVVERLNRHYRQDQAATKEEDDE